MQMNDARDILRNRKKIKNILLAQEIERIPKKIAVLGGSTTNDIVSILELFLLEYGIAPQFYQSEYGRYWQESVFPNPELDAFAPDIIIIHTTQKNIPFHELNMLEDDASINSLMQAHFNHFREMWESLSQKYNCPIIQNNFDFPNFRLLGNMDSSDIHGRIWLINNLNSLFAQYAQAHPNFLIHDINYLSSLIGIANWFNPSHWYMYKYAISFDAIPQFSKSLSSIIKSLFGKNKKCIAVDLDNTIWGGVVGDDGPDALELGHETPAGQAFLDFQLYLKQLKNLGITLCVCSKNDEVNAIAGLNHPDSILKPDDFLIIKANWLNKDANILDIANELNILPDSIIFADDNPAERHIVSSQLPMVECPVLTSPESYITSIDSEHFFELTSFSADDAKRNDMYKSNLLRACEQKKFKSYQDYLLSLDMHADIKPFIPIYFERIAQLSNKSNQFNLTAKKYSAAEIAQISQNPSYITLYGRLADKFGDNGVVSVVIANILTENPKSAVVKLWIMSCRVLKRDMEFAMLDALCCACIGFGIQKIIGIYHPTVKNSMVKDLYQIFGFSPLGTDESGNDLWELSLDGYSPKNNVISINSNPTEKELQYDQR